jgi:hypothetical protein
MLTLEAWNVEKSKLVEAQADIQSVIAAVDATFAVTGTVWSRTGVANSPTYSNSDLTVAATGVHALRSTVSPTLGKYYFEAQIAAVGTGVLTVGAIKSDQSISSPPNSLAGVGSGMWLWRSDTYTAHAGSYSTVGSSWSSGDTIMVAWDDAGKLWFGRNGSWVQGNPATGTSPVFTGISGNIGAALVFMGANGSPAVTGRFASPTYTPPSGFSLLA